jgi:hypothetical protein
MKELIPASADACTSFLCAYTPSFLGQFSQISPLSIAIDVMASSFSRMLYGLFLGLAVCQAQLIPAYSSYGPHGITRHNRTEPGHRGAVASESKECSEIGIELLKLGGNAADAVSIMSSARERGWAL